MFTRQFWMTYGLCFVAFLAIDAVWLGIVAPRFYASHIGHLLAPEPNFFAAALFYLIYIGGIVYFAVLPSSSIGQAAKQGAILGFFAYATFDFTSWAVMKDFAPIVVIVDLIWGTVLTGSVAGATMFWRKRFGLTG